MVDTPLLDKYLGGKSSDQAAINTPLIDRYLGADTLIQPPINPVVPSPQVIGAAVKQGIMDVSDSINSMADSLDLVDPKQVEKRTARRQQYEKEYGDNLLAQTARIGGQVLATAPLVPTRLVQAAAGANKLGAVMSHGLIGGATYGAGINSTNEEGLGANVATNAATGLVGAPIIAGAGKLGKMAIPAARSLMTHIAVVDAAKAAGVAPAAIKNTIQRLEDAGLSPQDAIRELSRLGSKATIADLDPALTTEASGLAALGGKPTAILKGRFGARADQANSSARDLITSRLGAKPDLEAEKQAIVDRAQILTGPDYKAAKASGAKLDVSNIGAHIDSELQNAVGAEASQLERAKSYLYKPNGDIKDDVASLHKVRQALDDTLSRLPREGTSQGTATYRAVSTIRDLIDSKLKSVPEMAAADAKFAEHMKIKEGLQLGYEALTKKTNKDEFIKVFNAAPAEMQDTIRKGLHAAIRDVMDNSGQGEASGAARLFNKKETNKEILRTAFGAKGESVVDAIHDEVAQRGTERAITSGSQTAERQAIRQRYEGKDRPHFGDIAYSAGLDALGGGGMAVGATIVKRGLTNKLINVSTNRLGQLTEGTADLLSRQGAERDVGMQVVDQVNKLQSRLRTPLVKVPAPFDKLSLPKIRTLAAPFGGEAYDKLGYKSKSGE